MSGLRDALDLIVTDVPAYGDLDRAIEQAGRDRRRRNSMFGGLAAAAAVAAVILGMLAVTRHHESSAPPVAPSPSPSSLVRNGQITSAERYLGGGQAHDWLAFDAVSGTGLIGTRGHEGGPVTGLAVRSRTGSVATLTCRDMPCTHAGVATLGPGAQEVTVKASDRTAHVIGYDGALHRTIDLSATVARGGVVSGLRWSPDGSRLAVVTDNEFLRSRAPGVASRIWLLGREGRDPRLAYSLVSLASPADPFDHAEFAREGRIWLPPGRGWSWSPDGQALLLDVLTADPDGENSVGGPSVVIVLHLQPDGAADPVVAQELYTSSHGWDLYGNLAWSPDGTRIAVRTDANMIAEISAEDGSVLAQHPPVDGWLIWPAKRAG